MKFKNRINAAINEKDVENIYRSELNSLINCEIVSPYNVDGQLINNKLNMLLEFKYDLDFKSKLNQCNVLMQCLYYLKKYELNGDKLPSIIFIGDINECFIIHSNSLIKYLSHDIDWTIAPSKAHKQNPDLLKLMLNDIDPFVYDITDEFDLNNVVQKSIDLTNNIIRKVRITKHNIVNIFNYFDINILKKSKLTINERANLFVQIITNPVDNYLHPKRKNILSTKSLGEVKINSNTYTSFFKHFEGNLYSPKEKEELTSLVDRLIDDTTRRSKGEFFTPTAFVDLAHKYISNTFGEDWKDEYVVWDCAAGTCNLTRDYNFKELYISTLEQSDLDTANQMGYNKNATKFQFDFLNDDDGDLPQALQNRINNGDKILFLINPPYAKATPNKGINGTGISSTIIGDEMKAKKLGVASSQLSTQFIYRILKFTKTNPNVKLCIFNKPNFMTSDGFKKIRKELLSKLNFDKGFLFNASHFNDVSKSWGISFSIWNNIKTNKNEFVHDLIDLNDDFEIVKFGDKTLYNCDNLIKANVIFKIKEENDTVIPPLKSFITVNYKKEKKGCSKAIIYMNNDSNNVMQQNVIFLLSSVSPYSGNKALTSLNINKALALFTARKCVKANWVNDKDEYIAPNEQHPKYNQFQYDSLIYSLFNNSSQQSSLRDITYKNKQYDIKNEHFWMSKNEIMELANINHYDELYHDAKQQDDRHMYKLLFNDGVYDKLSPDAKDVLDTATELVRKSLPMRQILSESNPEYHLDSYDAGYAQLKLVWKEYFKDEFKAFRIKYDEFGDRLRPLVYELGFLK